MYQLGLTPDWFQDIDTLFELISIIVTVLIATIAYKFYRLSSEEKYKWFSLSFLLIAVGYIFKILTNFFVYNEQLITHTLGLYTYTVQYIQEYYYIEIFGTLAFRFFMLVGLFSLYYLVNKCQDKKTIPLVLFLILITTIFSTVQYFAFHLTAALILGLIVWQYSDICKKLKKTLTLCNPIVAFGVLFISQLVFALLFLTPKIYVVAEVIQLCGFLLLLYNYISMMWRT
ncbi:MAG: hypothetical protein WC254_04855 [Candidatus Woesearchaeota archaeon]|jgi:hypothetical protein